MVWVYTLFCVHTVTNLPPQLQVDDTGIHYFANPTRWEAYFAELEPATPYTLPACFSRFGCNELKLRRKKNSDIPISEYKGPRVPRTYLSWNNTAFPNMTKALAGDYVCENEYGVGNQSYQLNVVGK